MFSLIWIKIFVDGIAVKESSFASGHQNKPSISFYKFQIE